MYEFQLQHDEYDEYMMVFLYSFNVHSLMTNEVDCLFMSTGHLDILFSEVSVYGIYFQKSPGHYYCCYNSQYLFRFTSVFIPLSLLLNPCSFSKVVYSFSLTYTVL